MGTPVTTRSAAFATGYEEAGRPGKGGRLASPWVVSVFYLVLAVVMTWPVAGRLGRDLPEGLGDPVEVCWILWWGASHLLRLVSGDPTALHGFWNGNIFYPHPLTLAYAEHLTPQAIEILPVYALTGNIVLCYNLLFLSTFVLSALGMYLLVRDLTGRPGAGLLAGLFYGFTPYRLVQLGHLQVLSAQWMPFVLLGMRRFFEARRPMAGFPGPARSPGPTRAGVECGVSGPALSGAGRAAPSRLAGSGPLAAAMLALVVQNLSCGYFLVYFSPFLLAYVVWEIAARRLWRDRWTWILLCGGVAAAAALTLPFLLPYLAVRDLGFGPRTLKEVQAFSADAQSYLLALDRLWLYPGGFSRIARPEAILFPGFTPLAFAGLGLASLVVALRRRVAGQPRLTGWRAALAIPVMLVAAWTVDLAVFVLFGGRYIVRLRSIWEPLAIVSNLGLLLAACALGLAILSRRVRAAAQLALSSGRVFFACAFCAAVWLSFGPRVTTASHGISHETVYAWLHRYVPGFNGVRVPARFGMLAMMFLAVLGGYGAACLLRRVPWQAGSMDRVRGRLPWRGAVVAAAGAFFLLETAALPQPTLPLAWPRRDLHQGAVSFDDMRPFYSFIARLPAEAVILEFPFCRLEGETRAMLLSSLHGHRLVNGYGGNFPDSYNRLCDVLENPIAHGEPAWQGVLFSRATHFIVHEWDFDGNTGIDLSRWLEDHGARPVARRGSDVLLELPR